jgi:hypothetical protein
VKLVPDRTDEIKRTRYKHGMTKTQTTLPSQSEAFKNMIREMWRQYATTSEKLVTSS